MSSCFRLALDSSDHFFCIVYLFTHWVPDPNSQATPWNSEKMAYSIETNTLVEIKDKRFWSVLYILLQSNFTELLTVQYKDYLLQLLLYIKTKSLLKKNSKIENEFLVKKDFAKTIQIWIWAPLVTSR